MRLLSLLMLVGAAGLCGCASRQVSRYDEFEKAKVDQMVGNEVSGRVFQRTLVCLNAMRESRYPAMTTNQTVNYFTNIAVVSVTNLTVTTGSNQQSASQTNLLALTPTSTGPGGDSAGADTNAPAPSATPNPATQGGVTVSTLSNQSIAAGTNQTVVSGTLQTVTTLSQQITVMTNNLAITTGVNRTLTAETNYIITTFTNQTVNPLTNVAVLVSDQPASDYYLYTEITPPPDFALQPGESLVLLLDGTRHAFAPATPQTAWNNRRGFVTTFYRVPPEVLVDLANAREARLRIRSTTGVMERKLSNSSRRHFRDFLLRNFTPEAQAASASRAPGQSS